MERRSFLSLAAVATMAAATAGAIDAGRHAVEPASPRGAAFAPSTRYRGTRDGKIYISYDGGRTWELFTDFGPALAVTAVKVAPRSVVANLVLPSYGRFRLKLLRDGRSWHTV